MLMDIDTEPYGDIFGLTHGFDLDVMEQTIIDDVMAEMSQHTSFPIIMNSVNKQEFEKKLHEMSDHLLDSSVIEATDVSSLLEQFEEASQSLDPSANSCDSNRYEITFHSGIDDNHVADTNGKMKSILNVSEVKPKASQKPSLQFCCR
ncbi:uncharacterized protein LOC127841123 [Dreissena polymorpha]|uniref:Uncharacterized protein n=1 Tax=Dreissena polymorpha TaxID=45954 RepID=A0A9D4ESN2_DREPO|nr:uncharacterized protein LOC127841123 [Dreissena polymorpha]XP_052225647.1 uncharacterized protein LOC127841123 [Dreissena polymorpha]XP_052225648.1 uncharacterized protein LOC127841123 [Dreissena polymorpha]KAH3785054.1 hypothetical protein DPMN_163137 [Dreissena polymorpha]